MAESLKYFYKTFLKDSIAQITVHILTLASPLHLAQPTIWWKESWLFWRRMDFHKFVELRNIPHLSLSFPDSNLDSSLITL